MLKVYERQVLDIGAWIMRRVDSHSASDHQKPMRDSSTVPCGMPAVAQRKPPGRPARRMALFATPASVFDDQTHCGYLRDAFCTLRCPKPCACRRENILITLIMLIKYLINLITG